MSETNPAVPVSKYWNADKKKFTMSSQFKDPTSGVPVGPLQYFEADSLEELLEKKDAAHESAAVKLYETRRANRLGEMLEPDPEEEPLQTFEEKQLTADDRVKLTKMLSDPAQAAEAHKILLEVQLGAPIETVRAMLREQEIQKRVNSIRSEIAAFREETPEYVECDTNSDFMKKYMEKKKYAYTKKNLKIAFEALKRDELLVLQAPRAAVPATPAPVTPAAAAPAPEPAIPVSATPAPAIPGEPPVVQPRQSSSGLGRNNSTAEPLNGAPKTPGITIRDINKMSAEQYAQALKDPEFKKQVDTLYAKK